MGVGCTSACWTQLHVEKPGLLAEADLLVCAPCSTYQENSFICVVVKMAGSYYPGLVNISWACRRSKARFTPLDQQAARCLSLVEKANSIHFSISLTTVQVLLCVCVCAHVFLLVKLSPSMTHTFRDVTLQSSRKHAFPFAIVFLVPIKSTKEDVISCRLKLCPPHLNQLCQYSKKEEGDSVPEQKPWAISFQWQPESLLVSSNHQSSLVSSFSQ